MTYLYYFQRSSGHQHNNKNNNFGLILKVVAAFALVQLMVIPCTGLAAAAAPSRIAVLGATGRLGSQTIRECLERDIPVRCLVRPSSVEKLPEEFTKSPLVEVVTGDILAETSKSSDGVFEDDLVAPSTELVDCLEGCGSVVACYGATRTTKFTDLFKSPEDIDPTHAKQINYRSMMALVMACKAVNQKDTTSSQKIGHIVRITGKGEEPTSIFTVLLNGLGSFAKAWNYQGEVVLRTSLADDDSIGYTIVRPGIMKLEDETTSFPNDDLVLADDGGNDLKVTAVTYTQMANLLVELSVSSADGRISAKHNNDKVTLASMNPPPDGDTPKAASIAEKISALQNDRRAFPATLVAEHKAAVKAFFTKFALVASAFGVGLVSIVLKIFF